MPSLPVLWLQEPRSELAQWLRIAGFPVRPLRGAPPVLTPGEAALVRVGMGDPAQNPEEPPPPEATPSHWLLVPREDWRQAVGKVFEHLQVELSALRPMELCPLCGERLQVRELPEIPGLDEPLEWPASAKLHCPRCPLADWPGESHQNRLRELREIYLEYAFRCVRCGQTDGARHGRNLARIEILCSLGPVEIDEEDLASDPSDEILRLLARLESTPTQEIEDSVAYHREQPLCTPCRRELVKRMREYFRLSPRPKGSP